MTRYDLLRAVCLLWLGLGLVLGGVHYWTVLPPIVVYVLLAIDSVSRPGSGWLIPVIRHGNRKGRKVALTFDDGPDADITPCILDTLKAHGAHATFFVIGRYAEACPQLIKRMLAEGHEVGNHSHSHSRFLNLRGKRAMQSDIEQGVAGLSRMGASETGKLYRPPMGLKNPALARVQQSLGFQIIAWSLHSGDTRKRDARAIARHVLRRIRPGDIVLFHDGHDLTHRQRSMAAAEALEIILPELRERGLKMVTVSELLYGNPQPATDPYREPPQVQARQRSQA